MSKAFVLVNCDFGTEDVIVKELLRTSGVSVVYKTQGVYDMIVRLDLGSTEALKKPFNRSAKSVMCVPV
jgi:hypothetical protein